MASGLRSIKLVEFRSFRNFTVSFKDNNFLVGPNNAGKSTILTSLRLADTMIRYARARSPVDRRMDGDLNVSVYPIPAAAYEFQSVLESVHYDFRETDARIELTWENENKLVAVWPPRSSGDDAYFYLLQKKKGKISQPTGKTQVIENFSRLGVIPLLAPLEYSEQILKANYIKANVDSRISTRHFRNNINLLNQEGRFEDFASFVTQWIPEITIEKPETILTEGGSHLDMYYREPDHVADKEIIWSGDGIQIWLQILFHIYRIGNTEVLILDEPDVYLHPDLQRRLMRLIGTLNCQIVLATHSTEIIAEAEIGSVIMIDKSRRRGLVINDEAYFDQLTDIVGSSINLRLVRTLRTKVTLFVEGLDMKLLNIVCEKLGLTNILYEKNISIISLEGKSKYTNVAPFHWLNDKLLGSDKVVCVLLDRDYQSEDEISKLEEDFKKAGVRGHVWRLKELESYFITPTTLMRLTGLVYDEAHMLILEATDSLRADILGKLIKSKAEQYKKDKSHVDIATVATHAAKEVDSCWKDVAYRMSVCPAKDLIGHLMGS